MLISKKELYSAKLVIGLITKENLLPAITKYLQKKFSKIDYESRIINFSYTNYYEAEFGASLRRKFVSFERLIKQNDIAGIKLVTNKIEARFAVSGKRTINIDPGYLTDSKLVLTTHKNFSHRIYLEKGVFAEVTLSFSHGSFQPWPWTYPDYRTGQYLDIFNAIREIYIKQTTNK